MNAYPQFITEIDGLDIHFIHVRSPHDDAMPLIMTHGWPGSVFELVKTIGPLTNPTAHGGNAEDAFHVVLPSMPGYGFSGIPKETGWGPDRIARAWDELMRRVGYDRYVSQGGDWGALVTDLMGRQGVEGLVGYHLNLLTAVLAIGEHLPKESDQERAAAQAFATFTGGWLRLLPRDGDAAADRRLRTADSPVALAGWLLDHDTDSYYKIAARLRRRRRRRGTSPARNIVDNITLYWLTGTAASAARSTGSRQRSDCGTGSGQPPPPVSVPVGFTTLPGEIWARRAAGPRPSTPASRTSTRSTGAGTSPPGRSRSSSRPRCGQHRISGPSGGGR